MTIAISIDKALDSVFARVALDAARSGQPPVAGHSEAPALRTVCRDVLRGFAARLGRLVRSADFDSDPDIVTLELDLDSDSLRAPVAGSVLCSALCLSVMAALHDGKDSEADFTARAQAELAILSGATAARIAPCSY